MQKVCILIRQILICDMQIVHPVLTGNLLASSKRPQEARISLFDLIKKIHSENQLKYIYECHLLQSWVNRQLLLRKC